MLIRSNIDPFGAWNRVFFSAPPYLDYSKLARGCGRSPQRAPDSLAPLPRQLVTAMAVLLQRCRLYFRQPACRQIGTDRRMSDQ